MELLLENSKSAALEGIIASAVETLAVEAVLAAARSLFWISSLVDSLANEVGALDMAAEVIDGRIPVAVAGRKKSDLVPENKDDVDSEDDDEDEEEDGDEQEDDDGEEDASGDEGDEEDDPEANGAGAGAGAGSGDEDGEDENEEDDDDDDDEEEDDEEDDEDDEEDQEPPAKKRK